MKREAPQRSATPVCALLAAWAPTVGLDAAAVGRIRRTTLYRQWHQAGLTRRHLAVAAPKRYRRGEAPSPGALWQSDVMNGPWIPDPTAEEPTRRRATYGLVLLDDNSRRVVAGRFAWAADAALLEELLAAAVAQWGAPERVYCDLSRPRDYPDETQGTVAWWAPSRFEGRHNYRPWRNAHSESGG